MLIFWFSLTHPPTTGNRRSTLLRSSSGHGSGYSGSGYSGSGSRSGSGSSSGYSTNESGFDSTAYSSVKPMDMVFSTAQVTVLASIASQQQWEDNREQCPIDDRTLTRSRPYRSTQIQLQLHGLHNQTDSSAHVFAGLAGVFKYNAVPLFSSRDKPTVTDYLTFMGSSMLQQYDWANVALSGRRELFVKTSMLKGAICHCNVSLDYPSINSTTCAQASSELVISSSCSMHDAEQACVEASCSWYEHFQQCVDTVPNANCSAEWVHNGSKAVVAPTCTGSSQLSFVSAVDLNTPGVIGVFTSDNSAIDGNTGSRQVSNAGWIGDFGSARQLTEFEVEWEACRCDNSDSILIDTSIDLSSWTRFGMMGGFYRWGGRTILQATGDVKARYVRISFGPGIAMNHISIYEVHAKGCLETEAAVDCSAQLCNSSYLESVWQVQTLQSGTGSCFLPHPAACCSTSSTSTQASSELFSKYRLVTAGSVNALWCLAELSFYDTSGDCIVTDPTRASAYTEHSTAFGAAKAFDSSSNFFCSASHQTDGWLQYDFEDKVVLSSYALTRIPGNYGDGYNPLSWTFEGSNDGSTWTTLDTQTNPDLGTATDQVNFALEIAPTYAPAAVVQLVTTAAPTYSANQSIELSLHKVDSTGPNQDWTSITSSHDNRIIAACVHGGNIWVSHTGGEYWFEVTSISNTNKWQSITASSNGQQLIAVARNGKMWLSSNAGVDWQQAGPGVVNTDDLASRVESVTAPEQSWRSIVCSETGMIVAAVAYDGHIWLSSDAGKHWTRRAHSNHWAAITTSASGKHLAAVENGGHIWSSSDSGFTWKEDNTTGHSRDWRAITSSRNGQHLAAAVWNGNLWLSNDFGVNWSEVSSFSELRLWQSITSSPDGTRIAAVDGRSGEIWLSSDTGHSWHIVNSTIVEDRPWYSVQMSGGRSGSRLAAVTRAGHIWLETQEPTAPYTLYEHQSGWNCSGNHQNGTCDTSDDCKAKAHQACEASYACSGFYIARGTIDETLPLGIYASLCALFCFFGTLFSHLPADLHLTSI